MLSCDARRRSYGIHGKERLHGGIPAPRQGKPQKDRFRNPGLEEARKGLSRDGETREQYVHARRYPTGPERTFPETGIGEQRLVGNLIATGVVYEITAAKVGHKLLFSVKPKGKGEEERRSFLWDTSSFDPVTQGRIGLRQMWTRSARYANFRVSELPE